MKLSKRFFALALAGVMVLALAACGGNGGNSTPPSQSPAPTPDAGSSAPAAPVEQVLKYGTDTWPAGFDPHTISAIAATRVFNQVYESLISFNPDMTSAPWAAAPATTAALIPSRWWTPPPSSSP